MTPEINAALPHLSGLSAAHARGIIKLVTDHIKGSDFTSEQAEDMAGNLETDVRWARLSSNVMRIRNGRQFSRAMVLVWIQHVHYNFKAAPPPLPPSLLKSVFS